MAIQGTQVLMYTKHTQFLYFSDLSIFFFIFKQNKAKLKKKKQTNMLNKTYHKTRRTKKQESKTHK